MDNCRKQVVLALVSFEKDKSYSNLTLDKLLSRLKDRERARASTLFYGVIERKLTLDYIISKYCLSRMKNLSPIVLNILRTALYQLRYMDSAKDYAIVSEAVELCRKLKNGYAAGFVNAVLRKYISKGILSSDMSGLPPFKQLEIEYSVPQELIMRWQEDYGESKTLEILKFSVEHARTTLKVNLSRTNTKATIRSLIKEGFNAALASDCKSIPEKIRFCIEDCLFTDGYIASADAYRRGWIYAQDISSQLCAAVAGYFANRSDNPVILDLCAAPGSKSFTIANILNNKTEPAQNGKGSAYKIYAYDLNPARAGLIRQGAKRLGFDINVNINDAEKRNENLPQGDVVLCDVPCSGFGAIRRKPEIKYKTAAEIAALPNLQLSILETSAGYVKENGILLYSTCTLLKAENEAVAARFLQANPDFEPEILPDFITGAFGGQTETTIFPGEVNDGFFMASFRRIRNS